MSAAVKKIPGRKSSALYELVFLAREIPALGYQAFYVSEKNLESEFKSEEPTLKVSKKVNIRFTISAEIVNPNAPFRHPF